MRLGIIECVLIDMKLVHLEMLKERVAVDMTIYSTVKVIELLTVKGSEGSRAEQSRVEQSIEPNMTYLLHINKEMCFSS